MKRVISLLFLLFRFILPIMNVTLSDEDDFIEPKLFYYGCHTRTTSQPLNYVGTSLISNSDDPTDARLCPGDAFGDLNETYATMEKCRLTIYHKGKIIWSIEGGDYQTSLRYCSVCVCALALQRDGNMLAYQDRSSFQWLFGHVWKQSHAQAKLNPVKTELGFKGQQLQIVQTFRDGSRKFFYADQNHPEFREDLGEPTKVADKFIIKSNSDKDRVILGRNEYIGDLNGTHLIFQEDCKLQLFEKNKVLWSFIPRFKYDMSCFFGIMEYDSVGIVQKSLNRGEDIMRVEEDLPVVQSTITFDEYQPIIIQTLKDGSEVILSSGPGQNKGLKLKREPRQVAEKGINFPKNGLREFRMERMDYMGNLTGLYLILQQNCSLMLVHVDQKLWELQSYPVDDYLMECSLFFMEYGVIYLEVWRSPDSQDYEDLLHLNRYVTGYRLTLENNQLVITSERNNGAPDLYHADINTRGALFQRISERSVTINHSDDSDQIFPRLSYIGDLNGIHAIVEENCNWVLYNKTQVIWESGLYDWDVWDLYYECELILQRDGTMNILAGRRLGWYRKNSHDCFLERRPNWSSLNFLSGAHLGKKVLKTELIVNEDGLWLINTLNDRTVLEYKAKEGTHHFSLQREKKNL